MKWEYPAWEGCSSRDPVLTHTPTVTDLSVGIRSVTTRTPLSRTSLRYKTATWRTDPEYQPRSGPASLPCD
jgi:hypothetical protein